MAPNGTFHPHDTLRHFKNIPNTLPKHPMSFPLHPPATSKQIQRNPHDTINTAQSHSSNDTSRHHATSKALPGHPKNAPRSTHDTQGNPHDTPRHQAREILFKKAGSKLHEAIASSFSSHQQSLFLHDSFEHSFMYPCSQHLDMSKLGRYLTRCKRQALFYG